jgi:acid phosphatase
LILLLIATNAGCGARRGQKDSARAPDTAQAKTLDLAQPPKATADRLHAQLWMEMAPEYKALCHQAFNGALIHVREAVASSPKASRQPVGQTGKPLAVVADLDETILDNSGYQAQLVLSGTDFSPETWNQWVAQISGVRLVPGALSFLQELDKLQVKVVFISNRPDSLRAATVETLAGLGVSIDGLENPDHLKLLLKQSTSNKDVRRRAVSAKYDVIAYLGDNLGDFPDVLQDNSAATHHRVDTLRGNFGRNWFVFPNPAYGSWTRPLRGQDPHDYLKRIADR